MSEENSVVDQLTRNEKSSTRMFSLFEKIDGLVDKVLGFVGNHPWESWMATANKYIEKYIRVMIAISAIGATLIGMIASAAIRSNYRVVEPKMFLFPLLTGLFAICLAPKALALVSSIVTKGEQECVRPELLQILKVQLGLGGVLFGLYGMFVFPFAIGLGVAIIGLIMIIVTSRPEVIGIKQGVPTNMVEEFVTLQLLVLKIVIAFLPVIVLLVTCLGLLSGFCNGMFSKDRVLGAWILWGTSVAPFVIPVAVYFLTLTMVFVLDLCRSIASIPRKIGELKK